jgi:hypothetical protein
VYKNYNNPLLLTTIQNFFITAAIDNFAVKPVGFIIYAFVIKDIHFVDIFIDQEAQIEEILNEQRVIIKVHDAHISAISPKKMRNSPSKVPKAL